MEPVEIEAGDLLLRAWQPDDAADVARACQDPELHRWIRLPWPYRLEDAEQFVTAFAPRAWAEGTATPLGVFDRETGELLGANGLINLGRGSGELAYWVAPWARGRGVATRATHAVAAWSLDQLGLTRLAWRAKVGNYASRLVAERLGFRPEGIMRKGGARFELPPVDCWTASLLPGQLRAPDAPLDPVIRLRARTFGAAQPRLSTANPAVHLRPTDARDYDAMVAACSDPESQRWTTVPVPYRLVDAEFFVTEHAPGRWARGDGAVFALAGPDDAFAGSMELRLSDESGVAEVGYLVAPWARGQGYASAALAALCRWAFAELGLRRIEWRAHVGNEASRRVALRAGFTMEGMARAGCLQRGEYRDAWTGAILAGDLIEEGVHGG
jgi:RimJ/RimL family protein N-acetyltransferase